MIVFKLYKDLDAWLRKTKEQGSIGFVPTMGALHHGHISLLTKSREVCKYTIASIFINPTQFNNPDDFKKYPKTLEKDIYLLEKNKCDILYMPGYKEIYPTDMPDKKHYELGHLEHILEGKYRPGHFQGVCQVVERLLMFIRPTHLFLGQKDFQQCLVLNKLITDLKMGIQVFICPTFREPDGLAMSSRNLRLDAIQRQLAPEIYKCLLYIKQHFTTDNPLRLKEKCMLELAKKGFRVDYVEIADVINLLPIEKWNAKSSLVALIAVFINDIRLIDNMLLDNISL